MIVEPKCQILVNFYSDIKVKSAIPKYSNKHLIKEEKIDFNNDTIKIDSLDSSKGILKIFVYIDGKREESDNKNKPNFYKIILKDYEIKNEFQNISFIILDNIEINMSLKIRNIIDGSSLASRINMFTKKETNVLESHEVISTGVNMKDRLKIFGNEATKNNNKNNDEEKENIKEKYIKKENKKSEDKVDIKIKEEIINLEEKELKNQKIEEINSQMEKEEAEIKNIEENNNIIIEDLKEDENIKEECLEEQENTDEKESEEENEIEEKSCEEEDKEENDNNEEEENYGKEIVKEIKGLENEWEILDDDSQQEEKQSTKNKEINNQENKEININNEEKNKEKNKEKKKKIIKKEEKEIKKHETKNKSGTNESNNINKNKINPNQKTKINNNLIESKEIKNEKENIKEPKKDNTLKNKEEKNKEKKPFKNLLKRFSCMLPENNFINKPTLNNPKKLDPNRIKMLGNLGGQRIIGQLIKNPNEYQKKITENEIGKSQTINQQGNDVLLSQEDTDKKNDENELTQNSISSSLPNEKRKSCLLDKNLLKKKVEEAIGFEILDKEQDLLLPSQTIKIPIESSLPQCTLESINYEEYLSKLNLEGKKEIQHETFCEGFFITSFPEKNGQVIENSSKFPASCGHKACSELPSMKPEIIYRYPLNDTKNLELNNLAATICFPTGIKMCYGENKLPKQIKDYVTQITNQKGERYYMRTFHFYKKMDNIIFTKKYEIHPLKHHLSKFADEYQFLEEEDYTQEIVDGIQKNLEFCQNLGFKDIVYIPCCICLISKYPYTSELKKCLKTIYNIISTKPGLLNFEINDLIMFLIHSIPIPEKNMKIQFYIPYCNNPKIELQCPKKDDRSIMNSNFIGLFKYLSIDNIILIFRLLLSEKKILFIHDDYTELTNITNSFISLLYPFKWVHTYIPIMSDQMLKYLETFLPFVNGIHISLMKLVEKIFIEAEVEDNEDVVIIYIKTDQIFLSSFFKTNKNKLHKYIQSAIPLLPFEKELKKELKSIDINKKQKSQVIENKIRDAFINVFVKMFYDYEKYIVNLNNDVVFNKVLFMQNIPNKEEKTRQFYDDFIDTQLFQLFTQNIINNNEYTYFKHKIIEFKEKENKHLNKNEKERRNTEKSAIEKEIIYLATPYIGLNLKDQEEINIETILDNYKITESENTQSK